MTTYKLPLDARLLHDYLERFAVSGLVLLPLRDRSGVRGTLAVWRDPRREGFTPEDLALLDTCLDYCALTLENAQLYEAEQRMRARLDATLDQLPVGVLVADEHGRTCLRNRMSREILGDTLEPGLHFTTLEQQNRYEHPSGELYAPGRMPLTRALAGEVVRGEEIMLKLPGGAPRRSQPLRLHSTSRASVKSARVRKKAVAYLLPFIEAEKAKSGDTSSDDTNGTIVMATVKGDVHDIGKNIVGVVLQCNNYEVIDLGVMVPAEKILAAAEEYDADIIGLSGLITPSLDEMVNFAVEMERKGLQIPLLIGGATTSRAHTAVKIAPRRKGPVVWVKDASRSVPVAAALLDERQRPALLEATAADYAALRERHAQKNERPMLTLEQARANRAPIDWDGYTPPVPAQGVGVRAFLDYDLAELREYIDWQPFFNAWEMKGRFPDILHNPASGEAARKLYDDAQAMLDALIDQKWLRANGVIGFFPANAVGDDIDVYTDETRTEVLTTLHNLRQQGEHREGIPNRSLGDYIAPRDTGLADYVGAFAVTAGLGSTEKIMEFKADLDDYSAILLESVADRLAEAFAERMHQRVREEFWGYQPDEHLDNEALIGERYVGIRPAPGYPACPEHTEKATIWTLMDVHERTGIELTDSMAMWPGAAVSGWYFSHPQSQYFVVGRLAQDQVADYAKRKGWTLAEAERWLSPNLGYNPED